MPPVSCPVSVYVDPGGPTGEFTLMLEAVHYLEHVAMRQHGGGFALHDIEVAAREADAFFRWGQQAPGLRDEALGVLFGGRRRLLSQRFIDHHAEEHTSELQSLRHLVWRLL